MPWLSGEKGWIPALVCRCMSAVPGSIPCGSLMLIQQGGSMDPVWMPYAYSARGVQHAGIPVGFIHRWGC